MSPQEFEDHYKICDKAPKQLKLIKTEEELKEQYLCKYGHKLSYFGTEYRNYKHSICALCEQRRISRSICLNCKQNQKQDIVYCCLCRKPPVKRSVCPQGHKFKIKNQLTSITCDTCDYCSKKVSFAGGIWYKDINCDYSLCLQCFNRLPKQQNAIYETEEDNNQEIQLPLTRRRLYS